MLTPALRSRRAAARPSTERPFGEFDACVGGWEIEGEPYTDAPGTQFDWWRARMLGGRTNHWGRISLRFGPDDFRGKTRDGLGDDWPIAYDDVEPYYDRIDRPDRRLRQQGRASATSRTASSSRRRSRAATSCSSRRRRQAEVTCIPARLSIITQAAQRATGLPLLRPVQPRLRGRTSNFSSPDVLIAPGARDGQAHADHQRDGARGDRRTGRSRDRRLVRRQDDRRGRARARPRRRARGERVRVGAAAAQLASRRSSRRASPTRAAPSASTSPTRPAPTSPGFIPAMVDHVPHNEDGVGGMHVYMPWWLDNKKLDFPRGYHIEVWRRARRAGVRLHGRHPALSGRRRLRHAAQGRLPPLLRRDDRLRRPRRDDPERRLLLRARSRRRRPVRHPGAALPLEVDATTSTTR